MSFIMLSSSKQVRIRENSTIDEKLVYWKCLQFNFNVLGMNRNSDQMRSSSFVNKDLRNHFFESSEFDVEAIQSDHG